MAAAAAGGGVAGNYAIGGSGSLGGVNANSAARGYDAISSRTVSNLQLLFGPRQNGIVPNPLDAVSYTHRTLPDLFRKEAVPIARAIDMQIIYQDEQFYTALILPWLYTDQINFEWDEWHFNVTTAARVPHEGISPLTRSQRSENGDTTVRYGLAFRMEVDNFVQRPDQFVRQLEALDACVKETVYADVVRALLRAQDYNKIWNQKYGTTDTNWAQVLDQERLDWCAIIKDEYQFAIKFEEMYRILRKTNITPNVLLVPPRSAIYISMVASQTDRYQIEQVTPDGQRRFIEGPRGLGEYRGVRMFETKDFLLDSATEPTQLLNRVNQIGEYNTMFFDPQRDLSGRQYKTSMRDIWIYNENADKFSRVSYAKALEHSMIWDTTGGMGWSAELRDYLNSKTANGTTNIPEGFPIRDRQGGIPADFASLDAPQEALELMAKTLTKSLQDDGADQVMIQFASLLRTWDTNEPAWDKQVGGTSYAELRIAQIEADQLLVLNGTGLDAADVEASGMAYPTGMLSFAGLSVISRSPVGDVNSWSGLNGKLPLIQRAMQILEDVGAGKNRTASDAYLYQYTGTSLENNQAAILFHDVLLGRTAPRWHPKRTKSPNKIIQSHLTMSKFTEDNFHMITGLLEGSTHYVTATGVVCNNTCLPEELQAATLMGESTIKTYRNLMKHQALADRLPHMLMAHYNRAQNKQTAVAEIRSLVRQCADRDSAPTASEWKGMVAAAKKDAAAEADLFENWSELVDAMQSGSSSAAAAAAAAAAGGGGDDIAAYHDHQKALNRAFNVKAADVTTKTLVDNIDRAEKSGDASLRSAASFLKSHEAKFGTPYTPAGGGQAPSAPLTALSHLSMYVATNATFDALKTASLLYAPPQQLPPLRLRPTLLGDAAVLGGISLKDWTSIKQLLDTNVYVPFDVILWRIFIEHDVSCAIMCQGGTQLGRTAYGHGNFMSSSNAGDKTLLGNYTFRARAMVTDPNRLVIFEHFKPEAYRGGSNTSFIHRNSQGGNARNRDSIIATLVRAGTTDEDLGEGHLDFLGEFGTLGMTINGQDAKQALYGTKKQMYGSQEYYTTGPYKGIRDMSPVDDASHDDYLTRSKRINTFASQGCQANYNPAVGFFNTWTLNQGHRGKNVGPGFRACADGSAKFIPTQNYASMVLA